MQVMVKLAEATYPITITSDSFTSTGEPFWKDLFGRLLPCKRVVLIIDANVVELVSERLTARFEQESIEVTSIEIPSGEASKCVVQLERVWQNLQDLRIDRKTVIVAVGGGVIGDLAGLAAATYARGLRFIQVPTTLLAMVDSSVGGKTGINLPGAKNIIGAFWQPIAVLIDSSFLQTLPEREYCSGMAEVIKYGMIMDAEFFNFLEANMPRILQRDPTLLEQMISRCCEIKAEVVSQDERETTGLRAILNYGHTFGHAIEATGGYGKLLHGEAISIGMAMAGRLAVYLKRLPAEMIARQNRLLKAAGLPIDEDEYKLEVLWPAMQSDKKVELGKLGFILPTKIGHVERVEGITLEQLQAAWTPSKL